MASSKNDKYENAANAYDEAKEQYTGNAGYHNAVEESKKTAEEQAQKSFDTGLGRGSAVTNASTAYGAGGAREQTELGTNSAIKKGSQMNAAQNEEARRYAAQQARATAAGAQSQATTAARAAGMNKAQAAMMGSQQNANAYQNAYGNAYSQQLGNAASNQNTQLASYNNAYENQANRANANINAQQGVMTNAQQYQQGMAQQSGQSALGASGTQLSAGQQEGQAEYDRTWGNWGNGLGIGGSVLKAFSDEDLKHYRECSKKVVIRSPKSIQKLKFVQKEN
jgi:hypothetical protein